MNRREMLASAAGLAGAALGERQPQTKAIYGELNQMPIVRFDGTDSFMPLDIPGLINWEVGDVDMLASIESRELQFARHDKSRRPVLILGD